MQPRPWLRLLLWALGALALVGVLCWAWRARKPEEPTLVIAPAPSAAPANPDAGRPGLAAPLPSPSPQPTLALMQRLAQNPMPPRDYVALAASLRSPDEEAPSAGDEAPLPLALGAQRRFWLGEVGGVSIAQITATLRLVTEHVEMWVEEGALVEQEALDRSARVFEERIYPTLFHLVGGAWPSGAGGVSRLVVLNARFDGAAGYFASANQYPRWAHPYSNACPMVAMNIGAVFPGTADYDAVLAHEYQHLLHWHRDRNEDAWLNEGCSELAEELCGFPWPRGAVEAFARRSDTQLTTWPEDEDEVAAHYGAAYLFLRYFLERFGLDGLRELVAEPANGAAAVDAVLARRGEALTFDDLWADWLVANLLDDPDVGDGRFGYRNLNVPLKFERVSRYPTVVTTTVRQYAADYYELVPTAPGVLQIAFRGSDEVKLVPNDPASGRFQWWSNRGDGGHAYLERAFDLTAVSRATLSFGLWYDLEEGWDYAYVRISTDGGKSWRLLRGRHTTDANPNGNALGPGYTGRSGPPGNKSAPVWVREEINLDAFCGQKVLLRFDCVTDDAVNRPGLCLDDFVLDALGWVDDAEAGEGDWHAVGFIRHENLLPQRYLVQLVIWGDAPQVQCLELDPTVQGVWRVAGWGREVRRVALIVSARTPYTTEPASYRLALEQLPEAGD